jgi:myo-inositol-1(or 4)-monophosphatase
VRVDGKRALAGELSSLRDIVLDAGRGLLGAHGRLRKIDHKSATDLVTDADRRAEALIVARLAARFPRDGIAAEEGTARVGQSGRTWFVDPLDGTTNFVHGHPFYAVSAACVAGDEPLLGAVFAPYLDELYLARSGGGAWRERPQAGRRSLLRRREPVALRDALLSTGFPYERDALVGRNARLMERFLLLGCHGVRRGGSAALDLCHVAAGCLDGHWEWSLKTWDIAAGALVAREGGALVTDCAGGDDWLSGASVLAAAPGLHGEMLEFLRGTPDDGR